MLEGCDGHHVDKAIGHHLIVSGEDQNTVVLAHCNQCAVGRDSATTTVQVGADVGEVLLTLGVVMLESRLQGRGVSAILHIPHATTMVGKHAHWQGSNGILSCQGCEVPGGSTCPLLGSTQSIDISAVVSVVETAIAACNTQVHEQEVFTLTSHVEAYTHACLLLLTCIGDTVLLVDSTCEDGCPRLIQIAGVQLIDGAVGLATHSSHEQTAVF